MFTLKFYNKNDSFTALCTPRYEVGYRHESPENNVRVGAIITIYPSLVVNDGVDYQVGMDDRGFSSLFIENDKGKTIDRIGPFDLPAETVAA